MAYTTSLTDMTVTGLGTVISERMTKDSGLFKMPLPRSDSTSAIGLDLMGANRSITIKGIFSGTQATVDAFIDALDVLINGKQVTRTFHSAKTDADYTVLVQSTDWVGEEGGVILVRYTITMFECATVT